MANKNVKDNILTKQGCKNTPARKAVLKILEQSQIPVSAEDIFILIRETGARTNLSTVYRTLELLESKGLVSKTIINDSKARYEIAGEGHHHHLICTCCHKMISIDECPLKTLTDNVGRQTSFDITGHKLELYGLCPECKNS